MVGQHGQESIGAIGEGERKIMGHYEDAAKAYTLIEVPVHSPKLFTYTTYNPVLNKIIAVSYTHLDVYKRQLLPIAIFKQLQ